MIGLLLRIIATADGLSLGVMLAVVARRRRPASLSVAALAALATWVAVMAARSGRENLSSLVLDSLLAAAMIAFSMHSRSRNAGRADQN